jgi:C4-dicarboxylate transporter, DctM subunit
MILLSLFLLVLALLGMPLFAVILAVALLGFSASQIDLSVLGIEIYRLTDTPLLMALPLFTLTGYIMSEAGTPRRLLDLSRAMVGWLPGSLAIVSLITCALFTAFTGASGVTIVAMGALLFPALVEDGYGDRFSLGLVTASGSLGLLFPPSLPLIIYSVLVQQMSIGQPVEMADLFLGGLFPGLLMLVLLSIWSLWIGRQKKVPRVAFSMSAALSAVRRAGWELPLPLFILLGVYGGFLAVSEAATVSALYVIIIEVFIYRDVPLSRLPGIAREALIMSGAILIIIGVSLAMTNYFIDAQVPMRLFETIQAHIKEKWLFLVCLNLFLLVLGALLDIFSALVIMIPLILPVAIGYGIDPVHLGIIFLSNMQIGYFTPPVGMNLFIASLRFNRQVLDLFRATLPFLLVLLSALVIITYWPALSLMLIR